MHVIHGIHDMHVSRNRPASYFCGQQKSKLNPNPSPNPSPNPNPNPRLVTSFARSPEVTNFNAWSEDIYHKVKMYEEVAPIRTDPY